MCQLTFKYFCVFKQRTKALTLPLKINFENQEIQRLCQAGNAIL